MFSGVSVFARELPAAEASAESGELTAREEARAAKEEQFRAEEEAHRAEVEQRRAEEEQRRAEEEKRREEEKNRRDESLRAMGIDPDEKLDPDNLPTRPPVPGDGEVTAADSGYSEVVYISTPEELMAIDGHDGGYYELQNDIDITGIEWKPLTLYNATFNGNNHAINGLTITKEPEYKHWNSGSDIPHGDAGLFDWYNESGEKYNNYILDLNLTNININITKTQDGGITVNALGSEQMFADNCKTSGEITIKDTSKFNEYSGSSIVGIVNGTDCENNVDINVYDMVDDNAAMCGAIALVKCSNSVNNGNIKSELVNSNNEKIYGHESSILGLCSNCISHVGINGFAITAMYDCSDCIIYGDVIGDDYVAGIREGSGNCIYGNITSENDGAEGIYGGSENCICGNITSENGDGGDYGIVGGSDNCIYGNIANNGDDAIYGNSWTYGNWTYGINGGSDNYIYGDITSENGGVAGIDGGSGNCIEGNVTSEIYEARGIRDDCTGCTIYGNIKGRGASGIEHYSTDCYIEGNITSENSTYAYGIGYYCTDCCIEGNITSENSGASGIFIYCTGCTIYGDIKGTNAVRGITTSCTNCYIEGNITTENGTTENGHAEGIYYDCTGCAIYGNITATNASVSGIVLCTNCNIQGSVTVTNGDAYGIDNGTNCYISGTVTEIRDDIPTLTASASSPFMGYFECQNDDSSLISTRDISGQPHCYEYYDNTPHVYGSYWCRSSVYYIYPLESGGSGYSPDPSYTIPPIATMKPQATREPSPYSLQVVDEVSGDPISGATVYIDGQGYDTDDSGVVQFKNSNRTAGIRIDYGGSVIYTDAGFFLVPNQMSVIKVKPFELDPEDLFAGNSEGTRLTGPSVNIAGKPLPIIDVPFNFDLNIYDAVKVAYSAESNTFEVLIGTHGSLDNVPEDADDSSWTDTYKKYKDIFDKLRKGKANEAYIKQFNQPNVPGSIGVSGDVSVCGFMEISLDDDNMRVLNGGITVMLDGSVTNSVPIPAVPLIYAAYGISGSLRSGLKLEVANESAIDPGFNLTGQVDLSITPSVGVGVGLRRALSIEIGLEGEGAASLKSPLTKLEECLTVTLTARFYAMVSILGKEYRHSQRLTGAQIYPYFEAAEAADIDIEPENMTTVQRDYLETGETAADADTVKSNLYPYSQVRVVDLSDGRTMMVWLDDDTSRALADKTAIYYSILENGTWSEPKIIEGDGTADFEFDIAASSNGAAIVWQSANRKLSENEDIYQIAKTVDIKYAEFDGTAWGEPKSVTSGNGYEYNPRIEAGYSSPYISYTVNDKDSPMPGSDETSESVYLTRVYYGEIGEANAVCENLPLVCDSAVYRESAYVIVDKDGDMTTPENVLYRGGEVMYDNSSELSGLHNANGYLSFTENGKLKRISGSIADITETKAEGSVMDLGNAAVYEVQEGFNSNLYASYYENGNWTNPVKITDYNAKIRSWDARIDQNGEIQTAAVLADTDENGSTSSVRLVYSHTEPEEDIALNAVYADGAVMPGKSAKFMLNMTNNTKTDLSSLNIRLEGEKSGVIFEGAQSVNIPAGESGETKVTVRLPEGVEKQNITATVTGENLDEKNAANNAATSEFGEANLTVEIRDYRVFSDGIAEAYVTNEGCETAVGARITVTGENGEVIIDEEIGEIAGGETKKITINLDPKYYTFEGGKGRSVIKAEVSCGGAEESQNDNSDGCVIKPQTAQKLKCATRSIALKPGAAFRPNITAYPESVTEFPIYASVDNEDVATVSADGTITAKDYGEAVISYMTPGVAMPVRVRVYVRESSAPVITKAEYNAYGENYGELRVGVDVTGCLAEGETETLIAAAYGESGALVGFATKEVTGTAPTEDGSAATAELYASINGEEPKKVKVMIWNSTTDMIPMSDPVEKEL